MRIGVTWMSLPLLLLATTTPNDHPLPDTVRIRVLEQFNPAVISLTARGAAARVYAGDFQTPIAEIAAGQRVVISGTSAEVAAELPVGTVNALSLRLVADGEGTLEVDVIEGRELAEPRVYPGALTVEPDPRARTVLRLINEVDLDEYVAAVLPREYGFDDLEGSKAMAVVIRTYALRSAGKYGSDYDHTDHVGSQVYEGVRSITPIALKAVQQTRGEVLTYRGDLIEATHFASSGGHTANNEDVWQSAALPYLRGRPDPYDESPYEKWSASIPRARLLSVLSNAYGGTADGFVPAKRSPDGRVQTVQVRFASGRQREISSNEFRLLVARHFGAKALKSTKFTVARQGDTYVFEGQGFGHGVGLNQWGAHAMAERGHNYRDILTFYYTGVSLASRDGAPRNAALQDAPTRSPQSSEPPASITRTAADTRPVTVPERTGW